MATWLLKTEPSEYSWDDLERDRRTVWDGVTNPLALRYMRQVRKGDEAIVYHTGDERAAVGIARVASDPSPDPRRGVGAVVVFEITPLRRLPSPVSLAEVKADPAFAGFELVRIPRLSVMPVPSPFLQRLLAIAGRHR